MTITELNRHMERRFDRLERTKADKYDLQRLAAKKDLRRLATKKDLRRFATKKDLRRFATKTEMQRLSVDIKRFFDIVAGGLEEKLQKVADGVAQIAAVQLHVTHHDKVLDEHETRIRALEQNP